MFYGLDVHNAFVQVCKLNSDGKVISNSRIGGKREGIEEFAATLEDRDSVVLESNFHSFAIHLISKASKAKFVVADANQVKSIAYVRVKTAKINAEISARLLRADFVPEVQMPSDQTWEYRQLVSHMRSLTKQKVYIKTRFEVF